MPCKKQPLDKNFNMPGRRSKLIFTLAAISLLFLYPQKFIYSDQPAVIINEIAWMGTEASSYDEWLELYNTTDEDIILEGWVLVSQDGTPEINLLGTIAANGYFLLERTDDNTVPEIQADIIYAGAMSNTIEILELRDDSGSLIDTIGAFDAWPAGDNSTKQTMERAEDLNWQTSEEAGGTPRSENHLHTSPPSQEGICGDGVLDSPLTGSGQEECDDGNTEDGDGCDSSCLLEGTDDNDDQDDDPDDNEEGQDEDEDEIEDQDDAGSQDDEIFYASGDIVVNEFVSDPSDEDVEWIELYNNRNGKEINLEGWTLEEGSGAKTELEGIVGGSGSGRYYVIEKPKGNLNNKGDIIILRDPKNNIIDQVAYGDWEDRASNAPAADDPNSVGRKFDGQNSYNNSNDFSLTLTPTKGKSNVIDLPESEKEVTGEDRKVYDYSDEIIITEIFPNPAGSDNEEEFIEIFNKSDRELSLNGWTLGDNSKKRYKIGDLEIKAGEYIAIMRADSKIALNNTSDSVKLFQPLEDEPFSVINYQDVIENWSYSFDGEHWLWTEVATPGEENIIIEVNHPPVVDFSFEDESLVNTPIFFDSSDTYDEDEDELIFEWDFGDGVVIRIDNPTHGYSKAGNYEIILKVSDGENEVIKNKSIRIIPDASNELENFNDLNIEPNLPRSDIELIINEILPNPEGSDSEGEWIEIKNSGAEKVNLLDWTVDDIEGGSKPYRFVSDIWLNPNEFYVLERLESGLALNNSNESVRLFDNFEELIEEIEYEKAIEGKSFSRGENGKFFWTSVLTPGEENVISVSDSGSYDLPIQNSKTISKKDPKIDEKQYEKISLDKISEYESGDLIITSGIVSVKPGILGSQYFYIIGSPGLQVYNYNKDFPDLNIGDYVEVTGELSVINGEKRLKTKITDDIVVLEKKDPPAPKDLQCENINEEYLGQLINVTGQIVEQKSSILYIDDGTDEIRAYIKTATGINPKYFKEGENVSVAGIVSQTKSGMRLMPRSIDDIVKKDPQSNEDAPEVLGVKIQNAEWQLAKRDKKIELFQYLLILSGSIVVVLSGLLVREYRK